MYLKKRYADRLEALPELQRQMALEIGVTPLTIYRALKKNKDKKSSKLTSLLGRRFLAAHFLVDETDLIVHG